MNNDITTLTYVFETCVHIIYHYAFTITILFPRAASGQFPQTMFKYSETAVPINNALSNLLRPVSPKGGI